MSVVASSSSSTVGAGASRSRRCWGVGKRRRGFMDERVSGREPSSSSGSGESWGNLRKIFLPRLGWVSLG